jgi:P4 family phage/plasmid primase-like protien
MFDLIKKYFQRNDDFYTHVGVAEDCRGKYYLSAENKDAFYNEYQRRIGKGETFFLAEKIGSTTPILVDVDLKMRTSEFVERLYTKEQVFLLVAHVQNVLKAKVVGVKDEDLICFVLEKDPVANNEYIKHGFHLHFPKIFVTVDDFKTELFEAMAQDALFKLDNVAGKPWLLYGACKGVGAFPYLATYAIIADGTEISVEDAVYNFKVYNVNGNELFFDNLRDMLPRIFSVNPVGKRTYKVLSSKKKEIVLAPVQRRLSCNDGPQLQLAEKLLDVLDVKRSYDYNTWWEIGVILFNVGDGSENALELFHYFSNKSEKYDANACDKLWNTLQVKQVRRRMGSLIFLCRQDDPVSTGRVLYEWKMAQGHKIPSTEYRIAYEFLELYPDKFLYCSKRKWFLFDAHIWKNIDDPTLYFIPLLINMSDWYKNRIDDMESEEKKMVGSLVKKLESGSSQRNIINQAAYLYHYSDVYELMDNNPNLIGFQNGVYDLEKLEFRDGLPNDFLSKKMPVAYREPTQESLIELQLFLSRIFPDEAVLDYFLSQVCEVFVGGNKDKIALFWTGTGNNGKSVTQKLFEKMLGQYAVKLPTTVITGKKIQAGGAHPELARLKYGVRWGVFEEFNSDEQIEVGILKHLTGNDALFARQLYEQGEDFTPMFKMIVICNKLPTLKSPDEATWNRIRVIPFESTFSLDAPTCLLEQQKLKHFPCNPNVDKNFGKMAETFAYFLIEKLKSKRAGCCSITIPDKVIAANLQYQKKCNKIAKFAEEILERVDQLEDADQEFDEMYISFRDWWNINFSRGDLPDKDSFLHEIKRLQHKNLFYKIRRFGNC